MKKICYALNMNSTQLAMLSAIVALAVEAARAVQHDVASDAPRFQHGSGSAALVSVHGTISQSSDSMSLWLASQSDMLSDDWEIVP
jgi:hypothetical protein